MSTSSSVSSIRTSEPKTLQSSDGIGYIGSVLFVAGGKYVVGGGSKGKVRRWRINDGREVGKPMNLGDVDILSLAASRDGKWIVSGTETGQVAVWNAETHAKVRQFTTHQHFPVEAVDVSPDGTRIVTGSHDSTVCVWSFSTGERLLAPLYHANTLAAVKYSPDGRLLATATCGRHTIRIYDSQNFRLLVDILVRVDGCDQSIVWSNDNKLLYALSDGNITCLDVSTGMTLSEWAVPGADDPRNIVLASNGRFIATSIGSDLFFWDTMTEKRVGPVIEQAGVILSMDISPNYDLVICGFRSTVVRSLRGILPSHYLDNQLRYERESLRTETENPSPEEITKLLLIEVRNLRAQHDRSYKKMAKLEDALEVLRTDVTRCQDIAKQDRDNFNMSIESFRDDFQELRTELAEFQRKADPEKNNNSTDTR